MAAYALEPLPLRDAAARVMTHGHRQSDMPVGGVPGTDVGVRAAHRKSALIPSWLPTGFQVGFIHRL